MPQFEGEIVAAGPRRGWACVKLPFHAPALFGTRSRTRVWGTINGSPFESWVFPSSDGAFFLLVPRELRRAAGFRLGERVAVTVDRRPPGNEAVLPDVLIGALRATPGGRERFSLLPEDVRRRAIEAILAAEHRPDAEDRASAIVAELLHAVQ